MNKEEKPTIGTFLWGLIGLGLAVLSKIFNKSGPGSPGGK